MTNTTVVLTAIAATTLNYDFHQFIDYALQYPAPTPAEALLFALSDVNQAAEEDHAEALRYNRDPEGAEYYARTLRTALAENAEHYERAIATLVTIEATA